MIRLEMKNYSMILIEKQPKYLLYHQGKIHKYEYLTGEYLLSSNQQQIIIEQARFTYSPLGKAFEKQIKTIEDQGKKQIKAIQDQGQVKTIKKYAYNAEDTPFTSKQKEIVNELVDERHEKITDLDKNVNSDDLIYRYKRNAADVKFDNFNNALNILKEIQNGEISIQPMLKIIKGNLNLIQEK